MLVRLNELVYRECKVLYEEVPCLRIEDGNRMVELEMIL